VCHHCHISSVDSYQSISFPPLRIPTKGGRESEPLSSWQNTVTTKSNNLFAHLKFRNRGRDKGQKDEENGKPAGVIEGKEKEPEK
jgi:hypothetical protein